MRKSFSITERRTVCDIADLIGMDAGNGIDPANSIHGIAQRFPDVPLRLLAAAISLFDLRRQAEQVGGFRQ
jgi:hypothetical protein